MTVATSELTWIASLLHNANIFIKILLHYCMTTIVPYLLPLTHFLCLHQTVETDHHFVREKVINGTLVTKYVPAKDQFTDRFTKGLPTSTSSFLRSKLGLRDYSTLD